MPPVAAHVDHGRIVCSREMRIVNSCFSTRRNRPVTALTRIKLRRYASTEPLYEPYLAALLIALAQQQWRTVQSTTRTQASGVKPKLLYSSDDTEFMHLYTTQVSSTLMTMFDDPSFAPPSPESLSIQAVTILYKPLETLRDRLLALVLESSSLGGIDKSDNLITY